ncbi:MAG: FecR family protein [Candidatus Acidiferrales bacterium]
MKVRRPIYSLIALLTCVMLAIPADLAADVGQVAGKITTVLPIVNVVRGPQQTPANTSEEVFWGDVINTGHLARARIALTDGSILSVGSDTNLTIAKHDAANQQTDLDLNYGQIRARASKLVKPDAHFKVRTPVGVAGVVGTEMIVIFDVGGRMQVLCMEGTCQVCDLALNCVIMHGGEATSIHSNQPPAQPQPPTPANLTAAVNATSPSGAAGAGLGAGTAGGGAAGGGAGAAGGAIVGVSAGVAAAAAAIAVRSVATTKTCAPPPPTGGAAPRANCVNRAGSIRLPGQRR